MKILEEIVPSYFELDDMEIVILQDANGKLLTIKIKYYAHRIPQSMAYCSETISRHSPI